MVYFRYKIVNTLNKGDNKDNNNNNNNNSGCGGGGGSVKKDDDNDDNNNNNRSIQKNLSNEFCSQFLVRN